MRARTTFLSWLAFAVAVWCGSRIGWALVREIRSNGTLELPEDPADVRALGFSVLWYLITGLGVTIMMVPWIRKAGLFLRIVSPQGALSETRAERLNGVGRWLISACFFCLALLDPDIGFFWIFPALIMLLPEFVYLAAAGFSGFIDRVFFPGGSEKKPPYSLKLARHYVEKNRWEDAEAEFTRVLSWHPEQVEAWQERLRAAFAHAHAFDRSQDLHAPPESEPPDPQTILAQGLKCLKTPADKEALFAEFNRLRDGASPTRS